MRAYEAFKNSAIGHKRKEQSKEVELDRMKNVITILAEENLTLKKNLSGTVGQIKDKEMRGKNKGRS